MANDKLQIGQSLFEVVVSIAVTALIIVAVVSLTSTSIRNSTFSKNNSLASGYAQELTEWMRSERDADTDAFITNAQTPIWCFTDLSWTTPGACLSDDVIAGTPFTRQATFSTSVVSGKTLIEVTILVSWVDAQGTHKVNSSTNFADWR